MGNFRQGGRGGFDRGNRSGGSRFGGGSNRFGGRDRGSRRGSAEMFDATCNECGKRCQVPFRPTGSKPVFCNDCFKKKEGSNSKSNDRQPQSAGSSEQFSKINAKLDKIIQVLENLEIYTDEEEYDEDEEEDEDEEDLEDDEDIEDEEEEDDSKPKSDIDY